MRPTPTWNTATRADCGRFAADAEERAGILRMRQAQGVAEEGFGVTQFEMGTHRMLGELGGVAAHAADEKEGDEAKPRQLSHVCLEPARDRRMGSSITACLD